jgi:membrane-associated protein
MAGTFAIIGDAVECGGGVPVLRLDLLAHLDRHLAVRCFSNTAPGSTCCSLRSFSARPAWSLRPFLPGDSLLFIAGALVAGGGIDVHLLALLLVAAAVLGNTVNYSIGAS